MWQTTLSLLKLGIMPLFKAVLVKGHAAWTHGTEIAKPFCDEVKCMLGVGSWIVKLTLFSARLACMARRAARNPPTLRRTLMNILSRDLHWQLILDRLGMPAQILSIELVHR